MREDSRDLEAAHQAQPRDLRRPQPGDVPPLEPDGAARWLQELGQQVEAGRLASAVWADQGVDGARHHAQIHPVHRDEATELPRQPVRLENRGETRRLHGIGSRFRHAGHPSKRHICLIPLICISRWPAQDCCIGRRGSTPRQAVWSARRPPPARPIMPASSRSQPFQHRSVNCRLCAAGRMPSVRPLNFSSNWVSDIGFCWLPTACSMKLCSVRRSPDARQCRRQRACRCSALACGECPGRPSVPPSRAGCSQLGSGQRDACCPLVVVTGAYRRWRRAQVRPRRSRYITLHWLHTPDGTPHRPTVIQRPPARSGQPFRDRTNLIAWRPTLSTWPWRSAGCSR